MAIGITSPVTGAAQTGLTSPTYTVTPDNAPPGDPGEQVAVTALGGTQTGVTVHSISSPFTGVFTRPATPKLLGMPNPLTGRIANIPKNRTRCVVRKGVTPAANQAVEIMIIKLEIDCPAGADTYDVPNVRAALSFALGLLAQQSAGLGETVTTALL